jgi:hypothetical protein
MQGLFMRGKEHHLDITRVDQDFQKPPPSGTIEEQVPINIDQPVETRISRLK